MLLPHLLLLEMGDNLDTVDLGTDLTVVSFATGYGSSCAILDDGDGSTPYTTKCWGKGDDGALGYGDAVTRGDGRTGIEIWVKSSCDCVLV